VPDEQSIRPATAARDAAAEEGAVVELAATLRSAERAHRAYLAELRQGDAEPADDWPTWYAEYLLGLR
jgi:hypothetical protein